MRTCEKCPNTIPPTAHASRKYCDECVLQTRRSQVRAADSTKARNSSRGTVTWIVKHLIKEQGGKCALCEWSLPTINQNGLEAHHIIAVRNGGVHTRENLIALCPNHHKMADHGLITEDDLHKARARAIKRKPSFDAVWERLRPAIERLDERRRVLREQLGPDRRRRMDA